MNQTIILIFMAVVLSVLGFVFTFAGGQHEECGDNKSATINVCISLFLHGSAIILLLLA